MASRFMQNTNNNNIIINAQLLQSNTKDPVELLATRTSAGQQGSLNVPPLPRSQQQPPLLPTPSSQLQLQQHSLISVLKPNLDIAKQQIDSIKNDPTLIDTKAFKHATAPVQEHLLSLLPQEGRVIIAGCQLCGCTPAHFYAQEEQQQQQLPSHASGTAVRRAHREPAGCDKCRAVYAPRTHPFDLVGSLVNGSSGELTADEVRAFRSKMTHTALVDMNAVMVVPFAPDRIFREYVDPSGAHANSAFKPGGEWAVLFIGGLPVRVTTQQIFLLFFAITGVAPVAIRLHQNNHSSKEDRSDATSAWAQVPSADAQRIIETLNKRVLCESVGFLVAQDLLVFRTAEELRRKVQEARYQGLPYCSISVVRAAPSAVASLLSTSGAAGDQQQQQQQLAEMTMQQQQQKQHEILHDPLCGGCESNSCIKKEEDLWSSVKRYVTHLSVPCIKSAVSSSNNHVVGKNNNQMMMPTHSNAPDGPAVHTRAIQLSNDAFLRRWPSWLMQGIGRPSCDAHRASQPGASAQYEFDAAWDALQKELRAARRAVQDRDAAYRRQQQMMTIAQQQQYHSHPHMMMMMAQPQQHYDQQTMQNQFYQNY